MYYIFYVAGKEVFHASSSAPTLTAGVVSFDKVQLQFITVFRNSISNFTTPSDGVYWISVSLVWDGLSEAKIQLKSSAILFNTIQRLHTVFNDQDVISGSSVLGLSANQMLSIFSYFSTYNTNMTNSFTWCGFRIDSLMTWVTAFEVYSQSSWISIGSVTFDKIRSNRGSAWNATSQALITYIGIYYISFSIGSPAYSKTVAAIDASGQKYCEAGIYDDIHSGTDIVSRGYVEIDLGPYYMY